MTCRIIDHALLPGDDVDREALLDEYAYAESEIYAELKELPFATEDTLGDEPVADIAGLVDHIRTVYPTEVAELILGSMAHRFASDDTVQASALQLFTDLVC